MEIAIVSPNCIKLRGKNASLVIDPTTASKTNADGIIVMDSKTFSPSKIEDYRLTIQGVGEYEVGGIKIATIGKGEELAYIIRMEGIEMLVSKAEYLEKLQEKIKEFDVAILRVDSTISQSVIPVISPKLLVLYGEKNAEAAKTLGKESPSTTAKVQAASGKLPAEMEIVVLR